MARFMKIRFPIVLHPAAIWPPLKHVSKVLYTVIKVILVPVHTNLEYKKLYQSGNTESNTQQSPDIWRSSGNTIADVLATYGVHVVQGPSGERRIRIQLEPWNIHHLVHFESEHARSSLFFLSLKMYIHLSQKFLTYFNIKILGECIRCNQRLSLARLMRRISECLCRTADGLRTIIPRCRQTGHLKGQIK